MNNIEFLPIHEKCNGCTKIIKEGNLRRCEAYINPSTWWRNGKFCPLRPTAILGVADIAKMAIKEGIVKEDKGIFSFNNQKIAKSVAGVTEFLKRNKNHQTAVKRSLGISDGDTAGKVRVGQQKQKKGGRR